MTHASKVLRYLAFGVTMVVGVLGSAFIVGEAVTDPGGLSGVLLSAAWVVPMVALATFAYLRPAQATKVLTVTTVLLMAFVVLDVMVGIVPRDRIGQVGAVAVFAVAVSLGVLGLHRPLPAGSLLVLVGVASMIGVLAKTFQPGGGPPPGAAIGGSSAAIAIPVLVIGGLFLLAAYRQPPADRGKR